MNVSDRVNDHKDENWGGGSKLDGPQLRVSDLRLIDKLGCPYDLPRMVVGDLRTLVLLLRTPEMIFS